MQCYNDHILDEKKTQSICWKKVFSIIKSQEAMLKIAMEMQKSLFFI